MNNVDLTQVDLDYILSPQSIRDQARKIFNLTLEGQTAFTYHGEKLSSTTNYVLQVIRQQYPDLNIPFHSRWGHFRAGGLDRVKTVDQKLATLDSMERARTKIDLVITSVLLDAGAGAEWSYLDPESKKPFVRSEGLAVASLHMFLSGVMSADRKSIRADASGLRNITASDLEKAFQVTNKNPLIGVQGRVQLLNNLASALQNKSIFKDGRPGNILDYLIEKHGRSLTGPQILKAVLEGLGPIWPGRLSSGGVNLGDVWRYSKLSGSQNRDSLIPFHKLSQWMTYSLIEPILESGVTVTGVENLTGLAEYRNGGLMIDSGLISLNNPQDAQKSWTPGSDLIIEWRALTIHLLDRIGEGVQKTLNKSAAEFPLAKVLEGGTWWAGRFLAREKRAGSVPPIEIQSDGTVF